MMKKSLLAIAVVLMAFGLGLWSGCSIDTNILDDGEFPCTTDEDCISGYTCSDSICTKSGPPGGPDCVDKDGDGYGVGETIEERADCGKCSSIGDCDEDCNDNDEDINPGAPEPCNNIDDNCNDIIDDETSCTSAAGCAGLPVPENGGYQCLNPSAGTCAPGSTNCTCQLKMVQTICLGDPGCPCNNTVQMCTDGMFPALPNPSECN